VSGVSGASGVRASCTGDEFVSVTSNKQRVAASTATLARSVTFTVTTGAGSKAKLSFDSAGEIAPDPLNAAGGSQSASAHCVVLGNQFTYLCSPTSTSFTVTVKVLDRGVSSQFDIAAIVTNANLDDCAVDSESISVISSSDSCGSLSSIGGSIQICADPSDLCLRNVCTDTRKRDLVSTVRVLITYVVNYRRVASHGDLRNTHEADCGPRIKLVNRNSGVTVALSTDSKFLSQGSMTISSAFDLPLGVLEFFDASLDITACKRSRLLIWNDEIEIRLSQNPILRNIDDSLLRIDAFEKD